MKPFDLEKALAGEPVVTRDGREVTQVTKFDLIGKDYVVYAVIEGDLYSFTTKGNCLDNKETVRDLFMAPKKLSGFVNVYESGATGVVCKTKKEADYRAGSERIACIDLSQFEEGHGL